MHADFTDPRFDQLTKTIDEIKNSPDDKQISLSVPSDLILAEVEEMLVLVYFLSYPFYNLVTIV